MKIVRSSKRAVAFLCAALLWFAACGKKEEKRPDTPRLNSRVTMRDVIFHSAALNRDMSYRVVLPSSIAAGHKLPVVYLLHGLGGSFRDWTNYSNVATFAAGGLILVMPEGDSSYYVNSAQRPQNRYEDYIVNDLISEVEGKFPAAHGRPNRAIVGISMGGFGAVNLSFRHPELFVFAGALSPAVDAPTRPFSLTRIGHWREHSAIFGAWGSKTRRDNDPFVLVRSLDPTRAPYVFLSCGEKEGFLRANRRFAALLGRYHFRYEFHPVPGGHDWNQWNQRLPDVFRSLSEHLGPRD
jgi:S-formylglutathione hydrolase FrmB